MEYSKKVKNIIAIVILIIILGIAFILSQKNTNRQLGGKTDKFTQKFEVKKTETTKNKLPENFPANVPIEANVPITQNFNATANDGRLQATREFITSKSLSENYSIYKDFMKNSGWEIVADIDQPALKILTGTKDSSQLQVTISTNSVSNKNSVNISYSTISK